MVPHAADVILEAWGATRAACLEEAVLALVESFVDSSRAAAADHVPILLDARSDEDALIALLEDVLLLLDARGAVPVAAILDERADGRVVGRLDVAAADEVEVTGAVPKGVSRSGLVFEHENGRWRCRVLVDV